MEFFGRPPDKTANGPDWKISLWSHLLENAPGNGRRMLFLASFIEGHVQLEGAKVVEAYFLEKVVNTRSGMPDDLVAFHDWSNISDIDVVKCRGIFTSFIKKFKPIHREIVININLSGKFLGGNLIEAVLTSVSFFHKGLISKYDDSRKFQHRIRELEKKYAGKRLSSLPLV